MADSSVRNSDARLWQSSVNDDTADTNSVDMSSPGQKTTDDAIQSAVSLKAAIDSATEIDPDTTDVLMADLHVDVGPDATVEVDAAANSDALNDPNAAVGSGIAVDLAAVVYLDVAADLEATAILGANLDLETGLDSDASILDTIVGSGAAVDPHPAGGSDAIVDAEAPADSDVTVDSEAAVDLGSDSAADLEATGDSIATANLDITLSLRSLDWPLVRSHWAYSAEWRARSAP